MMRWSVSQSTAWECPLRWWFAHRAQVPPAQPDPLDRVRGRAEHVAMETAYRAAAAEKRWEPGSTMDRYAEPAAQALETYWRGQDPQVFDWHVHRAVEDVTAVLSALVAPYPSNVAGVERRFAFEWTVNGFTFTVGGVMDLALGTRHAVHVRDWKHETIGDPARSPQMAAYDQAVRCGALTDTVGSPPSVSVGLYSIRRVREESAVLTDEQRAALLHSLAFDAASAADAAQDEREGRRVLDAFPARPGPDTCDGCPFRSYCPETSRASWPVRDGVDVDAVRARVSARLRGVDPGR